MQKVAETFGVKLNILGGGALGVLSDWYAEGWCCGVGSVHMFGSGTGCVGCEGFKSLQWLQLASQGMKDICCCLCAGPGPAAALLSFPPNVSATFCTSFWCGKLQTRLAGNSASGGKPSIGRETQHPRWMGFGIVVVMMGWCLKVRLGTTM